MIVGVKATVCRMCPLIALHSFAALPFIDQGSHKIQVIEGLVFVAGWHGGNR